MDDLISRQAAIDALKNRWKKTRNYEGNGDDIAEECELYLKQVPSAQPEPCEDAVSRNAIIQKLNTMDRYVSEELILCDTDKKFPKNEVFIVDDVYEEIVENLPSAQPELSEIKRDLSDLISRQAAIDALERKKDKNSKGDIGGFYNKIIQNDIDTLMQLPSAQPERKKGHWEDVPHKSVEHGEVIIDGKTVRCSVCKHAEKGWNKGMNYCPECGAKMEEQK